MFGSKDKEKDTKDAALDKAPISFNNPTAPVVPKIGKEPKAKSNSTTLIARDTQIQGDIKFSGNLEVEGSIKGNIIADAASEASIRVLEEGCIEGDIFVPRATLNGQIKGNVHAANLELAAKARIDGNVNYQSLEMTKGAKVNGSLVYTDKMAQPTEKNTGSTAPVSKSE